MRTDFKALLESPYPEDPSVPLDHRFERAIGVVMPRTRALEMDVATDLMAKNRDTGWWATACPDASQRALIADYLCQVVESVVRNVIEARLHANEAAHHLELASNFHSMILRRDEKGRVFRALPPRTRPWEDWIDRAGQTHIAGFFRALSSAADCLGGVIVGVLGLQSDLIKADIDIARKCLGKIRATDDATRLQVAFRADFERLLSAPPQGWREWASDYRNMIVHRGRRIVMNTISTSGVARGDGLPFTRTTHLLHAEPGVSDVEMAALNQNPLLTEGAETSMSGALESMIVLAEGIAGLLSTAWAERRTRPSLIVQPTKQWAQTSSRVRGFKGYAPGSIANAPQAWIVAPETVARIQAAGLAKTGGAKQ